ncbi:hypothetical protein HYFRA_00006183 [Hymenoscyphus fraxineus]|uniref:Extracellular membrane protein CFEM domain-containing protein n=1 Tax=Hymenoscyphus fraxineus TaxID=746836 RepID=A0A9N9L7G6_9HELO|nr:hypothetical protein HYFRA_00006183 [Hymenoscyphus fraxineus]
MKLFYSTALLGFLILSCTANAQRLGRRQFPGLDQVPICALGCLATLVPQYCTSFANTTCICTDNDLLDAIQPCVFQVCNITESLRVQRFQKDSCGVQNDKSRQRSYQRTAHVFIIFCTFFIAARCYARVKLGMGMAADDWVMVAAGAVFMVVSAGVLDTAERNFGQHLYYLTTEEVTYSLKWFYVQEIAYNICGMLVKLSLLLFFMRIFPAPTIQLAAKCFFAIIVVTYLLFAFLATFQCWPIRGAWSNWMYKSPPIKCIEIYSVVIAGGIVTVVYDAMILLFPLPEIWKLQLPKSKKIQLMMLFSLGIFVVACSTARVPLLFVMLRSTDVSWDQQPVGFWSETELGVGIICACLPPCRALVMNLFPRLTSILGSRNTRQPSGTPATVSGREGHKWKGGRKAITVTTTTTVMGSFIPLEDMSRHPDSEKGRNEFYLY